MYDELVKRLHRRGVTVTETELVEYEDPQAATTTIRINRVPAAELHREMMAAALSRLISSKISFLRCSVT